MIATTGRILILLALFVSAAGALVGFWGGARRSLSAEKWARRLAYLFSAFMIGANLLMVYALLKHDFSVSYVAQVGSLVTPTWVTIVSLWSSLEGSILFWGFILGVYVAFATWFTSGKYPEYMSYAIGTWLGCGAFFSFLIAGPAQPFLSVPNPPTDGPGPNPLLQNHILMAAHPPFLYGGYVGMTIPFGLASAALLVGRLGHDFLRPLRRWILVPWIFLTIAIVLGGWWAYEVLGWGGYWAWDPVENASFLPWLTATAALHSIIVLERKNILKAWTMTLVMGSFLLTILGTFMTRSGVFNSVHSFTQSSIGPTILAFLAIALLWSVGLLAARIDKISGESGGIDSGKSREGMFLVNNLLFVIFTFTVLIGTVFPLVVEALRGVQMSVGRPYFDKMAVPIGVALLLLMGVGPALPWGRVTPQQMKRALLPPLIGGVIVLLVGLFAGARNPWTLIALLFGGYTAWVTLVEMWLPVRQRVKGGESVGTAIVEAQFRRGRRRFASYIVHAGATIVIVSIAVSSTMRVQKEFNFVKGQSAQLGSYTLTFLGTKEIPEPNRQAVVGEIEVTKNGKHVTTMGPRMNFYFTQREPIGTPKVYTTLTHDLYLSVMNIDPQNQTLGLHAMINPMIGWIWIATFIMGLGGVIGLIPTRKRREETATAGDSATTLAAGAAR